jgi:hypothetical protein
MQTIAEWLDLADEQLQYLDWRDEFRYALGYRVQSDATEKILDISHLPSKLLVRERKCIQLPQYLPL